MPKKAKLENHLNVEELKQKYKISQDTVEARRWNLLWKIALGWTIKNSALAVGIDYEYAKKIVKKYNESGVEGVKNKRS
jgi:molybdenum-dependent DNA-binding transcriptional regulator ModE